MKKILILMVMAVVLAITPTSHVKAQIPIVDIIKAAVKKVIKAMDLQIQRLQNKTIALQNAQKKVENTMAKLKLDEITGWVEKQKNLYKDYYEELSKVKAIISSYRRLKDMATKQVRLVQEYKRAWELLRKDKHFRTGELDYMQKVYNGILAESEKNIDQILMVASSFQTQMSDGKRLELINETAERVDQNYFDLTSFNEQNMMLSLHRSLAASELELVRKYYGLH